jgi:hypothetical protein
MTGSGDTPRPVTTTPAQQRFVTELLAWGVPRQDRDPELVETLLARLTPSVAAWLDARPSGATSRRPLLITKTRLSRLVCDGLQQDPVPYSHSWANVRGTLAHAAIEQDVLGGRSVAAALHAEHAWRRSATDRPGDPASLAAWLNVRDAGERAQMLEEVAALVSDFREVWPDLSAAPLQVRTEQRLVAWLGGRAIRLQGVPDLIVGSTVADGRPRTLIVDLKTGLPRGQQDRDELRFYALLQTLRDGVPPFRWATFYVTEGRLEHEDLDVALLHTATDRVADALLQAVRLASLSAESSAVAAETASHAERLRGGGWCARCLRQERCPVAEPGYGRAERTGRA